MDTGHVWIGFINDFSYYKSIITKRGGTKMQPEKKFKAGAVTATVWQNIGKNGSFVTVKLSRTYMDRDNNWKDTSSFKEKDIPKAALVLQKAYEYLQFSQQRFHGQYNEVAQLNDAAIVGTKS